jgi:DNA-directed RNA polymerase specialized sigma24 family protein
VTHETDRPSVTRWLRSLEAGENDGEAVDRLWRHYFDDLVRLARSRLRDAPRAVADEEDAALSALESFCKGASRGRYPRLGDRDDLWRLLVVITERKAFDQAQRERRQKRGGGRVLGTPDLVDADQGGRGIAGIAAPEPTPEFAALMADECGRLLGRLRDDSLREVARLRMEGYTNEEVADRLGCSLRSVARKLELIRRTWLGEGRDGT